MHVGQVYFNKGDGDASQRIAQGDAGMRECRRVDDNKCGAIVSCLMDAVDQRRFRVALHTR